MAGKRCKRWPEIQPAECCGGVRKHACLSQYEQGKTYAIDTVCVSATTEGPCLMERPSTTEQHAWDTLLWCFKGAMKWYRKKATLVFGDNTCIRGLELCGSNKRSLGIKRVFADLNFAGRISTSVVFFLYHFIAPLKHHISVSHRRISSPRNR